MKNVDQLEVRILGLHFRVKDSRQKDSQTIAEVSVEATLTPELADSIIEGMAADLYLQRGRHPKVKTDMREAGYDLAAASYVLELRKREGVQKHIRINGVTVRKLEVYKNNAGDGWLLGFTVGFVLLAAEESLLFVEYLRKSLYVSFIEQEPALELGDAAKDGALPGTEHDVDGDGTVNRRRDAKKGNGSNGAAKSD
jgi:hypothetical protein